MFIALIIIIMLLCIGLWLALVKPSAIFKTFLTLGENMSDEIEEMKGEKNEKDF